MLVSTTMIAQTLINSWSELLTAILVVQPDWPMFTLPRSFSCNVSNPAQNRPPWPVMVNCLEMRNARRASIAPGRLCHRIVLEQWEKERRWIDGTRHSSVAQSAPQTASFHH